MSLIDQCQHFFFKSENRMLLNSAVHLVVDLDVCWATEVKITNLESLQISIIPDIQKDECVQQLWPIFPALQAAAVSRLC